MSRAGFMKKRTGKLLFLLVTVFVMLFGIQTVNVFADTNGKAKVTFKSYYDTTDSKYEALNVNVKVGRRIRLPEPPAVKGYKAIGWALTHHSKTAYKEVGDKFRVKRDITFYAVYEKDYKIIKFRNNSGKNSAEFKALTTKTTKKKIKLPEVPQLEGYKALGWTTQKRGTKALYKAGSKFKMKEKSTKLYAVYEEVEYYTVNFYRGDGSRTAAYRALTLKVAEDTVIKFPEVPSRTGYVSIGWSNKKNPSSALKATSVKVTKNLKYYAVQKKGVEVNFYNSDGSELWKTSMAAKGQGLRLPTVANVQGSTFMGWSTARGKTVEPNYLPGSVITIKTDEVRLYAVMYDHSKENASGPISNAKSLTSQTRNKYKEIIFVGDSRTHRMAAAMSGVLEETDDRRVKYISEEGAKYTWFSDEGYDNLIAEVEDGGSGSSKLPTAVIINVGVNDMGNVMKFITFMNGLASELKDMNCKLFFMTLNPINSKDIQNAGYGSSRTEEGLLSFNSTIQKSLKGYTIINTYNFLMRNGFVFDTGIGADTGKGDGLHYSENTYRKIYNMCITKLLEV